MAAARTYHLATMKPYHNIAAYQFVALHGLRDRRKRLIELCQNRQLKGTILLSSEGINLFVAGAPDDVNYLLAELRGWPGLENLETKSSRTDYQPFRRMLVRIKKEIIAFGVDGIDPATRTSPKLPAKTLKQWLDEGRQLTLLDTRNDYEIKLGTFHNALPIGVDHFRDFPAAVRKLPPEMKEHPIVMFCTGGIRCEKAGPFMESEGFKTIYQLDGGILKYFEECGGAHYHGECFVFDQRVGLDPSLNETESSQCFQCQTPLTAKERLDERYAAGKSCPYCFKTPAELMATHISRRHEAILRAVTPLPGARICDHFKPVHVPEECDGKTLLDALCRVVQSMPVSYWINECEQGLVLDEKHAPVSAVRLVRGGERYLHKVAGVIEPEVNGNLEILYEDEAIIALNKPAPLPVHPGGRFFRNTLRHILNEAYHPQKPRPVHRLDANTTGVLIMARTRHFAGLLQKQFTGRAVEKTYLARVQGHPPDDSFSCHAPISAESSSLGARLVDWQTGLPAETRFQTLRRHADGTATLQATPITGRTNQIRIHLSHLGFPVCGDPTYLHGGHLGDTQTLHPQAPPLCLHAWRIECHHPLTGKPLAFTAPPPGSWNAETISPA